MFINCGAHNYISEVKSYLGKLEILLLSGKKQTKKQTKSICMSEASWVCVYVLWIFIITITYGYRCKMLVSINKKIFAVEDLGLQGQGRSIIGKK